MTPALDDSKSAHVQEKLSKLLCCNYAGYQEMKEKNNARTIGVAEFVRN